MRSKRSLLSATVLSVLAGSCVALSAPSAAAAPPHRTDLAWGDCPPPLLPLPPDPALRCTTLRVPLDHRAPGGPTVDLAVSRMTTAKPGPRRGILIHNGGGPGVPSLHLPVAYARSYPQEVLDQYDLVSFDPRGIGYSNPVTCGRPLSGYPNDLLFPFPSPDGSITRNVEFAKGLAHDCLTAGGDVLPHITTANTARDMDLVRAALGEPKASYNSGSYGSYLGAVYASLFPGRMDRFVIDSNVNPNRMWQEQLALWDPGNEIRFGDLTRWLAERNDTYRLGATPAAVRARYFALVARLDTQPAQHPELGPVNGTLFRAINRAYMYHTMFFPTLAEYWVFADRGGVAPAAPTRSAAAAVPADNQLAGLISIVCNDARWPRDVRYHQHRVSVNRVLFPVMNGMGTNIWPCAFWPDPVEPPVRVTDNGPRNILMVQTLRDPATPYVGALGMRRALGSRAQMVTVDSGNHGAYDSSTPSCAVRAVHRYLATGALPDRDQYCRPDPQPATAGAPLPPLLIGHIRH